MASRKKVPLDVALDIVPDDLPDGAYFAMLEETTGLGDELYPALRDHAESTAPKKRKRRRRRPRKREGTE